MKKNSGQSLVEVLVGLAVGALLIGAASMAIAFVLRAGSTTQTLTTATEFSQDLMNKVKSFALSNWNGIYNLSHGTSTANQYFLVASSTGFIAAPGEEGTIDNEIKNGLVGRWGFDEGTGTVTYDESGNGDNGSLVNSPTWQSTSTCKISYCLGFNASSSQYVSVPGISTINFSTNGTFTISAWVDPSTFSSDWRKTIIKQENYLNSGYRFGFDVNGQPLFWTTQSGGTLALGSSKNMTLSQWNFLAVTFNNQQAYMYVNGMQTGSSTGTYIAGSTNNALFGYAFGGTVEFFTGMMDDIRFYNRALSASEVGQLYNSSVFRRYFYVQDACRSISATSSSPLSNLPCGGSTFDDPSTQQVTAVTEWDAAGKTSNFSLSDYVTRWSNSVFNQSDWSGGINQNGIFSVPSNQYASATNITTSSPLGSIEIQNLTQQ